jgi:hypothetical protein
MPVIAANASAAEVRAKVLTWSLPVSRWPGVALRVSMLPSCTDRSDAAHSSKRSLGIATHMLPLMIIYACNDT